MNFIMIMTDQQRYDSLGCLGNSYVRTPVLDKLGKHGIRFLRHLTPIQSCSPSRGTVFSGLYPRHHGLHRNGVALDDSLELIGHAFQHEGYRTHGVGKFHFQPIEAPVEYEMPDSIRFWQLEKSRDWRGPFYGFDRVDTVIGESAVCSRGGHYAKWLREFHPEIVDLYLPEHALEPAPVDLDEAWKCAVPEDLHYNSWIANRSIDFLNSLSATDRFFLFVSFPDPHHPFSPPRPYCDLYNPGEMPLPKVVPGELEAMPSYIRDEIWVSEESQVAEPKTGFLDFLLAPTEPRESFLARTDEISEASIGLAIAHTYGAIEMIDTLVGRILRALDEKNLSDQTAILFTSDHGELLGDHGLLRKGPPPYRQLIQVPAILSVPNLSEKEVRTLTSHLDIKATILDLFGLEGDPGDGVSLMPLAQGKVKRLRDHLFAEYHPRAVPNQYNQSIITDEWRFTRYPGNADWGELFNSTNDPDEHFNLFSDPSCSEVTRHLNEVLDARFPARPHIPSTPLSVY